MMVVGLVPLGRRQFLVVDVVGLGGLACGGNVPGGGGVLGILSIVGGVAAGGNVDADVDVQVADVGVHWWWGDEVLLGV